MTYSVREFFIPPGHPNRPGVIIKPIALVVHYTANDADSATDTANARYMMRPYNTGLYYSKSAGSFMAHRGPIEQGSQGKGLNGGGIPFRHGSAHSFCDADSATRTLPFNEMAYGCGDRQLPFNNGFKGQTKLARDVFGHRQNHLTISLEICNNTDWEAAVKVALQEAAHILTTCGIGLDRVYRHFDLTGKICPKPFVDSPEKWADFKRRLGELV